MTAMYAGTKDKRLNVAATFLVIGVGILFMGWVTSSPDAMEKIVEKIALGAVGLILAMIWWVGRRIKRK